MYYTYWKEKHGDYLSLPPYQASSPDEANALRNYDHGKNEFESNAGVGDLGNRRGTVQKANVQFGKRCNAFRLVQQRGGDLPSSPEVRRRRRGDGRHARSHRSG